MAAVARDHEPPAVWSTVALVLSPVVFFMGLIVPSASMGRHVLLVSVFGVVCLASGWRALSLARRRQFGVRLCSWIGILIGAAGMFSLVWQLLVIATGGAFPPPFWSPYANRPGG